MNFIINGNRMYLIVLITFIISALLIPIVKKIAIHINAMDEPNERKVHIIPVPRLGGLAIFLAFLSGYMLFAQELKEMLGILIGGMILILVGIFDDIKPVPAKYKLIGQVVAAGIAVYYGGILLKEISAFGLYMNFGSFSPVITIIFIVAIINAINLIDGIDGLAGGISSIYFATIAVIAVLMNKYTGLDMMICLIMLGSTMGFLVHNFCPAKIFMGDTGSMFLGYMISIVALLGFKNVTLTSFIVPILILAIPIIDTILAIFRRLLSGQPIGRPDKEHIHHQLLKMKFSMRKTVFIIYGINIIFSAISIFYVVGDALQAIILYAIVMILLLIFVLKTNVLFNRKNKVHQPPENYIDNNQV